MAETLVVNGVSFQYPDTADEEWGDDATGWAVAVTSGMLQKAGGVFALTSEVDFGSGFGVKTLYAKSRASNPASAGWARLGNTDTINWRNFANGADLPLGVDTSDNLTWNGVIIASSSGLVPVAAGGTGISSYAAGDILYATGTTTLAKLAIGAANRVITSSGTAPQWTLLVDANIDAAAAITRSKLASGTAYRILANDSSGVASENAALTAGHVIFADANGQLSGEAQLSKTRGGTGVSSTATFPSSGVVVTEAATETLSNKTFSDAIGLAEISTPATPSSGFGKIYFKSDGFLYQLNDDGSETKVGAGSGSINYVLNPDAESNTNGWATYADAAGIAPVNGTGGSPTVTWTRNTSSPLRGVAQFRLTKDAANRQGEGVSYDFTTANADKAQPITISFEYHPSANFLAASSTALSDIVVYIYDITNSVLIQPVPYQLGGGSGANQKFSAQFQTNSNSTSYRLIFHIAGTGTTAWTVDFDNIVVGPQVALYGAAVTDWLEFTPTGSWSANTTYTGYWRRVGDSMQVVYKLLLSGAPTATALNLDLPSGFAIDVTKLGTPAAFAATFGFGLATDTGVNGYSIGTRYNSSTTNFDIMVDNVASTYPAQAPLTHTVPFTFGNTDEIDVFAQFPISGWGSNVQMSTDSETRVVAARATRAGGAQSIPNSTDTIINYDDPIYDTHGAFSNSGSRYTAPVSGFYKVTGVIEFSANSTGQRVIGMYKNGSLYSEMASYSSPSASFTQRVNGSDTVLLRANDYLELYAHQSSGGALDIGPSGSVYSHWEIERVSGPQAIASSETVAARYTSSSGQSIPNNSATIVDFATKDYDTHNAVTTGASWKFTAPASGKYSVKSHVAFQAGISSFADYRMEIFKNGSIYSRARGDFSFGTVCGIQISDDVYLLAGDYIQVKLFQAGGAGCTLDSTAVENTVAIAKVGNF